MAQLLFQGGTSKVRAILAAGVLQGSKDAFPEPTGELPKCEHVGHASSCRRGTGDQGTGLGIRGNLSGSSHLLRPIQRFYLTEVLWREPGLTEMVRTPLLYS